MAKKRISEEQREEFLRAGYTVQEIEDGFGLFPALNKNAQHAVCVQMLDDICRYDSDEAAARAAHEQYGMQFLRPLFVTTEFYPDIPENRVALAGKFAV